MRATTPIGWLLSNGLLAAAYYLLLTPIGMVLRLAGHDALRSRIDREATTYWQPRRRKTTSSGTSSSSEGRAQ